MNELAGLEELEVRLCVSDALARCGGIGVEGRLLVPCHWAAGCVGGESKELDESEKLKSINYN